LKYKLEGAACLTLFAFCHAPLPMNSADLVKEETVNHVVSAGQMILGMTYTGYSQSLSSAAGTALN
jgi:hypothetical protein